MSIISIQGQVEGGLRLGTKIGFPTLNIPYSGDERGVFAGRAFVKGEWYPAAIHIGNRPTINDDMVVCESHLIAFSDEVEVGTEIKLELVQKIRDVEKFENVEALKQQIGRDVEFVKNWYNSINLN